MLKGCGYISRFLQNFQKEKPHECESVWALRGGAGSVNVAGVDVRGDRHLSVTFMKIRYKLTQTVAVSYDPFFNLGPLFVADSGRGVDRFFDSCDKVAASLAKAVLRL